MFDQDTLNQAWGSSTAQNPKTVAPKKKGPGGIEGFLVNSLPAIGSGIGAVGGSFLAPVAGTVGGGAAGGALGEAIKRKILGEKEDVGQIATQGLEGGLLSGAGAGLKGVTTGAKALTTLGKGAVEETAPVAEKTGGSFLKNLTTQGQQAQGRVAGVSAGSKVAGKELTPQDTEKMLQTFKSEGIQTGNANNTLRDVTDKLKSYGKQIADHFKTNDAPLTPEDTKVIGNNFITSLKTTDPAVLDKAQIEVNDLQKNVKSTKDLWEYRKTLDNEIPGSKQTSDENLSNKVYARKSLRQYIAKELGNVPGMKEYHDLADIKPFVSAEAKRLNNPGGGIIGRVLSSGPVQKGESLLGKGTESLATKLDKGEPSIPIERGVVDESQPLKAAAGATPPPPPGEIPEDILQSASQATTDLPQAPAPVSSPNFLQKLVGAAANPIANPGKTSGAIIKQEAGRGFGVPAAASQAQPTTNTATEPNISQALLDTSAATPEDTNDPYSSANVAANVQAILAQGGKQKDVSDYLSNVADYQKLTQPSTTPSVSKPSAQQQSLASSALDSIQKLSGIIQSNPDVVSKDATPGQGLPIVGGLVSRVAGTSDYHTQLGNVAQAILHLQTGAAFSAQEKQAVQANLPRLGDTSQEIQDKLETLSGFLSPFLGSQ